MKLDISINILRGPHHSAVIPELSERLKGMDVILAESILPKSQVKPWTNVLNALSNDANYIASFSNNLERNLNNYFVAKLAWALKARNIRFDLVDVKLNDDQFENQYEQLSITYKFPELIDSVVKAPEKRYELVDSYIYGRAKIIKMRDNIVVEQVAAFVSSVQQGKVSSRVRESGQCNISVVLGYLHNIEATLRNKIPDVRLTDELYDKKNIDLLKQNPVVFLMEKKLKELQTRLPEKDVDYFLYLLLMLIDKTKTDAVDTKDLKTIDRHINIIDKGFTDTAWDLLQTQTTTLNIDTFSENELKLKVEALLQR